jgi:hypothetical protein
MDDPVNQLLQELRALRQDVSAAQTEARAQHVEITNQIGSLSERLILIDGRIANMESRRWTAGFSRLAIGNIAAIARAAILG